jgi:diketogulonate reductase-like aldo/keto reductase
VPYDPSQPIESQVRQSLEKSLSNLKTEYLDCILLHSAQKHDKMMKIWKVFEEMFEQKKVRQLGISNIYDIR